jgi:oxygen-independent coproporphyrinogen-3 oxidase
MNVYLHIPFCASLCAYCDFTSFAGRESSLPAYVAALRDEIRLSDLQGPLSTVYVGGGTPSLLSPQQLASLLDVLREKAGLSTDAEISLEANPDSARPKNLAGYREAGVNRLSIGAQAAQDSLLKTLGRRHDAAAVARAVTTARVAGFDNLSLDVMFGLPGQTREALEETLDRFLGVHPEHLSLYALQVEEGTPLAERVRRGLALPGEDEQAEAYQMAQERLASEGLRQYEVSNFARPGRECRHNLAVWRGEDYQGFGVAAVGTVGLERRAQTEDLSTYLAQHREGCFRPSVERLSEGTRRHERMFLGMRTREGVSRLDLLKDGASEEALRGLLQEGFLLEQEGRISPSPRAYLVLNAVLGRLYV